MEEGIYRLNGSSAVIKSLKEKFNHEGDVHLLAGEEYYDIHAVAGLLKLYLRDLPSSVLTRELHKDFLQVVGKDIVVSIEALLFPNAYARSNLFSFRICNRLQSYRVEWIAWMS